MRGSECNMDNIYVIVKSKSTGISSMTKIREIAFDMYEKELILISRDTGEIFASIELNFNPKTEEMSSIVAKLVNKYIKQSHGEGLVMTTGDFINNLIDIGGIDNRVTNIRF